MLILLLASLIADEICLSSLALLALLLLLAAAAAAAAAYNDPHNWLQAGQLLHIISACVQRMNQREATRCCSVHACPCLDGQHVIDADKDTCCSFMQLMLQSL